MPRLPIVILLVGLFFTASAVAGERYHGRDDTARHPPEPPTEEPEDAPSGPMRLGGSSRERYQDPALEHYWSPRCVEQRRYGMTHTKDCDNPAYTGSRRYGYPGWYPPQPYPYPSGTPYRRDGAYDYYQYPSRRGSTGSLGR